MARYIRLYDSLIDNRPASVLGFSFGIANGVWDPELHRWLHDRKYSITPESFDQSRANLLSRFAIRSSQNSESDSFAIPEKSVSASHLLVEPPFNDSDLLALGSFLERLSSIGDGGARRHYFIDNRTDDPLPYGFSPEQMIAQWG